MPWNCPGGAGRGGIQGWPGTPWGASGVMPGIGKGTDPSGAEIESGTIGTGKMGMGGKTSIISSSELLSISVGILMLGFMENTAMLGGILRDISGACCFLLACRSSSSFASDG